MASWSISFWLRNVIDHEAALREMARATTPSGPADGLRVLHADQPQFGCAQGVSDASASANSQAVVSNPNAWFTSPSRSVPGATRGDLACAHQQACAIKKFGMGPGPDGATSRGCIVTLHTAPRLLRPTHLLVSAAEVPEFKITITASIQGREL